MAWDRTVLIEDLGSKNGTLVRGQAVTTATVLHDGDDIVVGTACFVFRAGASDWLQVSVPGGAPL
jgi:pSer/pThr/pTyr-binding forkhead associated (FHA) protein